MKNPLAEWCKRVVEECIPKKPTRAVALDLVAGNHEYIILYNQNQLSRSIIERVGGTLFKSGIKAILIGCDDPTRDMTYLRLAKEPSAIPGPDGFSGNALTNNT
jgi:hypothetical protein